MAVKPPHPPDETVGDLRAALMRNHPELSPAEVDALLAGEPNKRHFRLRRRVDQNWTAGQRGKGNGQAVHRRGRRKR